MPRCFQTNRTAGISASVFVLLIVSCVAPRQTRCPLLMLQSVGWSEAAEFWDDISEGLVIDVEECCHNDWSDDGMRGLFRHFGGDGGPHDEKLRADSEFRKIAEFLQHVLHRIMQLMAAGLLPRFVVTVLCAWGKHRSRLEIEDANAWVMGEEQKLDVEIAVKKSHLSTPKRQLEIKALDAAQRRHCRQGLN